LNKPKETPLFNGNLDIKNHMNPNQKKNKVIKSGPRNTTGFKLTTLILPKLTKSL